MTVDVKKLPESEIEISGEIAAEEFEKFWGNAVKNISQNANLPGFRPGNIPERVLIDKIGEAEILEEAAELSIKTVYPKILLKNNIEALGEPEITITKLARKNPLGFKIKTAVLPEIKLTDYKKISSEVLGKKEEVMVEEKEIEAALEYLRKSEERRNSPSGINPEEIKNTIAINDDFAKRFGNFENLDALKSRLKETIKADKEAKLKEKKRVEILDMVSEKSEIELPKILVKAELLKMFSELKDNLSQMGVDWKNYLEHIKKTEEDLNKEWEEEAKKRVRYGLVLRQIAASENIQIDDSELKMEVDSILSRYSAEDRMKLDQRRLQDYAYGILRNEKVFKALESLIKQ